MPLKLNVGIFKKIGQPGYSSLGASCNVEVELDQSLLFDNFEAFQERVKNAYMACREAVAQELHGSTDDDAAQGPATADGVAKGQPDGRTNGHSGHRAT